MAIRLMVVLLFITACASKVIKKEWKEEFRENYSNRHKITFGEASIMGDEAAAIKRARSMALAEMAKTFFVNVSSSAEFSSYYQKTSNQETMSENTLFSQILEESRNIELSGIDLSQLNLDYVNGIVTVAAVMDLQKFEAHIKTRIQQLLEGIKVRKNVRRCIDRDDLKRIREVLNTLLEADEREVMLSSFTHATPDVQRYKEEYLSFTRSCRQKFIFTQGSQKLMASGVLKRNIESEGFRFLTLAKGRNVASIEIHEIVYPPEIKFERINLKGRIDLTIKYAGDEFRWSSVTLRQMETSTEDALLKLKIRLVDEAEKGIKVLIKENF